MALERPAVPRRGALLGVVAAAALVAAGCSGSSTDAAGSPSAASSASSPASTPAPVPSDDGAALVQPGRPGEPNRTGDATPLPADEWTAADAAFVTRMVPHHAQALEMAALAADRAGDPSVTAIAGRISAAQGPEITAMAAWLRARDLPVPPEAAQAGVEVPPDPDPDPHGGHGGDEGHGADHGEGHEGMPGMATPEQLEELAGTRGADFDRRFLTLMVTHHEGALRMAEQQRSEGGADVQVEEMADHVIATQTAEIQRMQGLLAS